MKFPKATETVVIFLVLTRVLIAFMNQYLLTTSVTILPTATCSVISREDIASINEMTSLIDGEDDDPVEFRPETGVKPRKGDKRNRKRVNTKLIYFLQNPSHLLPAESKRIDHISDKTDYDFQSSYAYDKPYQTPVNHYQTNTYKTNNYEYKPPVHEAPPKIIHINTPVPYHDNKEDKKWPMLLIGSLFLVPLISFFLQLLLFLFFMQNNNLNITINLPPLIPPIPGRRRRDVSSSLGAAHYHQSDDDMVDIFSDRLARAIHRFDDSFIMT